MDEVILDGGPLAIEEVVAAANGALVSIGNAGRGAALKSRDTLERLERGDETIYGVNTGFGALKSVRVAPEDAVKLQRNLIRSHAAGVGAPLGRRETRAAMTLLAASHLRGASGIGPEAAELCADLLNRGLLPSIPSRGSLGASGDLAPLAHLAMALIGELVVFDDEGKGALLGDIGIQPLHLVSKAGLSLINGTHVHTGLAALLVHRAGTLAKVADIACAMAVEAMLCSNQPFRADVHSLRPHAGQALSAANVMRLTEGSALILSHANCGEVQDAYSIRCAPQVHGAARQTIRHTRETVETEMASVTDNPLVVGDQVISAGHFHGEPVGLAMDYLKIGVSEFAAISERRSERALNSASNSGLPAFLAGDPGLESGLMICQYTAAALVSENKVLSHPSCVDSITTGANQEDHVSMAMNAALHARTVSENVRRVLAIEMLVMAQALDCRRRLQPDVPGAGVRTAHAAIREQSSEVTADRSLSEDVEGFDLERVVSAVEAEVGELA
ncbi:MAG: histidine ammonia-lyase [Armatimonadota bacterium]|nr:histidine ammonia-lyase [Armatimonadota bacterium]